MATLICPNCHGDGTFICLGGPGYFDRGFGNYLPSETEVDCATCEGFGEVDGCATCGYQECECDEVEEAA